MNKTDNFLDGYEPEFKKEIQEFLDTYMLNSESNEGYRYFPHSAIKIYPKERLIEFHLQDSQAHYGTPNFEMRTEADETFLSYTNRVKDDIFYENKLFSFQETKVPNEYLPKFGGRAAITLISLYTDKKGKTYLSIPLTNEKEVYKHAGKLSGGGVLRGKSNKNILTKIIKQKDPSNNPGNLNKPETNSLFFHDPGSIQKVLKDFQIGDWTLKFINQKGKFDRIESVYPYRADDGTFEFLKTQTFYSENEVKNYYNPVERVSFKRPVVMVEIDELGGLKFEGDKLRVEKLFYDGEEIKSNEIPEDFQHKFSSQGDSVYLDNFTLTPPLKAFIGQLKITRTLELYKKMLAKELEHRNIIKTTQAHEVGEYSEELFSQKIDIPKNTKPLKFSLAIPDGFEKIIEQSALSSTYKNTLIDFIINNGYKNKNEMELVPDFIIEKNNATYFIEYKKSIKSHKRHQIYKFLVLKLFGENTENLSYLEAIGSNYNSSVDYGLKAKRLSEEQVVKQCIQK